ncbi:uncharacterized protein LOC112881764 isoform X2 [Panicum hallii]|uniref:uncharacterized protein LOC112881764 isoform X2 n=1 Tax=Panicum hallii TaxID=206008 RepID=UPI000DF4D0BC|nr:uncharacterized protein LOC112881764 isoform X2 [Panicum hallii]
MTNVVGTSSCTPAPCPSSSTTSSTRAPPRRDPSRSWRPHRRTRCGGRSRTCSARTTACTSKCSRVRGGVRGAGARDAVPVGALDVVRRLARLLTSMSELTLPATELRRLWHAAMRAKVQNQGRRRWGYARGRRPSRKPRTPPARHLAHPPGHARCTSPARHTSLEKPRKLFSPRHNCCLQDVGQNALMPTWQHLKLRKAGGVRPWWCKFIAEQRPPGTQGESQRWRKCATQVHCREQRPLALRYDDSQRNKYNYAASNFRKYWIPVPVEPTPLLGSAELKDMVKWLHNGTEQTHTVLRLPFSIDI